MKTLSNINDIEKIVRKYLISQSQLESKFVRNSLSLHGEELEKLIFEQVFTSIDVSDCMILFELKSRDNSLDFSETEKDGSLSYYKSYTIYTIIYGDNSTNIANKLVTRFRTEKIRQSLQNDGVYLEKVSEPSKLNEYKNETMWIRNDIEIDIRCHIKIDQVEIDESYENIGDLSIENY